jgi:hypothetical protein
MSLLDLPKDITIDDFRAIWLWDDCPYARVFLPKLDGPLYVKLPPSDDNPRTWLREDADGKTYRRRQPKWDRENKQWELPRGWRNLTIRKCVDRYGACLTFLPGRAVMEKCAPECWNAKGDSCSCSCCGANHGIGENPADFYVINETLAVKWDSGDDLVLSIVTPAGSAEVAAASA